MSLLAVGIIIWAAQGTFGPSHRHLYSWDRDDVQLAVTYYMTNTSGSRPITGATMTMSEGTFDIIDICELIKEVAWWEAYGWWSPGEVPESCADSVHDNCDAGSCSCYSWAHYIWLLDNQGNVASTCVGTECNANNTDGYQGVYP